MSRVELYDNTFANSRSLYEQLIKENGRTLDVSMYDFYDFFIHTYNEKNYIEMMGTYIMDIDPKYAPYINLYKWGVCERGVRVFAYTRSNNDLDDHPQWKMLSPSVASNLSISRKDVPFINGSPLIFIDMERLSTKAKEDIDEEEDIDNGMRNWMKYVKEYEESGEIPHQYSPKQFEKLMDRLDIWADLEKDNMF